MATAYTQAERPLEVTTPLGPDVLLLTAFTGQEEMSRLFSFELELMSEKDSISPKDLVGKSISFSILNLDGSKRHFNGLCTRFAYCGRGDRLNIYRMQLVPWLWMLTRTTDCRIFQEKKVPEIIEQIFKDLGFSDYETGEIKGDHPKWDYCVQYRETDFNFVSRLMEQEGIYYYFRHEQGKHTLVLADSKGAYKDCVDGKVEMKGSLSAGNLFDTISSWEHQYEFRSGKFAHTDYNFETPSADLMAKTNTLAKIGDNSKFEIYDYPGEYEKRGEGDGEARIRMEEEEARYDVVSAQSLCRSFGPGYKLKVTKHHAKGEEGKSYVITGVRHSASQGGSYLTGGETTAEIYSNTFTAIPDNVTYRPPRLTAKPMIHGVQTAKVVGPRGEEIYPDKYGRVKVQFYWDREGQHDEKSSCWIRCSQISAGKGWGTVSIPRIGQEVVVTYLEGDPDRPLITGVVYNAEQMPAYSLPADKTKTYIKTNSSMGGDGFNELSFEDKGGEEQIFIHAQKNVDTRIKNDSMLFVAGNQHQIIGMEKTADELKQVGQDSHVNIKRHQVVHIEEDRQVLIGGNEDHIVEKDRKETIEGDHDREVKKNLTEKVNETWSMTVGSEQHVKVGQNYAMEAGMEVHIKAGMKLILEAGMQLTIKAAGGFIDIGPAGVTIQGTLVNINSGGAAGKGSGAKPKSPKKPKKAKPTEPKEATNSKTGQKSTEY